MKQTQFVPWKNEYDRMIKHNIGTYTSTRAERPSPTYDAMVNYFAKNGVCFREGNVLDVACGVGRNAIPCAEQGLTIYGTEIIADALGRLRQKAKGKKVNGRIHLMLHDLFYPFPFKEESFDFVFDITVSNNILDEGFLRRYLARLTGLCKVGGYVLSGTIDESDEFLQEMLHAQGVGRLLTDPRTQIIGRWYTREEIRDAAEGDGRLVLRHHELCAVRARMGEKEYSRCYNAFLWQRMN